MSDLDLSIIATPRVVPSDEPQPFEERPSQGGSRLDAAAEVARANRGAWVFVGYTKAVDAYRSTGFINDVGRGRKVTLGADTEEWVAKTLLGVIRDGEFVVLATGESSLPDEVRVYAKYIAYLGPRTPNGEPVYPSS